MVDSSAKKLKPSTKPPAKKVQSLRGRIPEVPPLQAEALRGFFAASRHWLLGDGGVLRFVPAPASADSETFSVDAEGTRLQLRLESDTAVSPAASGLHWSDYAGRARLLAWSLAHETSLMRLSEVLGVSLLPLEPDGMEPGATEDAVWLEFSTAHDLHADAGSLRGALRLPVAWLPRLQARAEPVYEDDPLPPLGSLHRLPVPIVLGFDGPMLAPADWQRLRPGDVVVVGSGRMPGVQARAARYCWPLAAAPDGWRITSAAQSLPSPSEHSTMNDESRNDDTGTATETGSGQAVARNLPVQLAFDIGRIEVSIGDLAELQPGYVFALPAHLEGANVVIRANGRAAGRGEVVAVGETLGVRLLSWD
jgi:type III secretion protein Q